MAGQCGMEEYRDKTKRLIETIRERCPQTEIMKKKRYLDLTGNLLNHPNDFLARIQAQVLAAVLGLYEPKKD